MCDAENIDDENTAFPAPEKTPGQAESRAARARFLDDYANDDRCSWWQEYLQLRIEGWDWRKAAYIAWAASPNKGRWPANQQDLATEILGLKSDRTIRNWREKIPELEQRVASLQIEPLMKHRRDAINALVDSMVVVGKNGSADRRTYFSLIGMLGGKNNKPGEQPAPSIDSRPDGSSPMFAKLEDDELEQVIKNLQAALGRDGLSDDSEADS